VTRRFAFSHTRQKVLCGFSLTFTAIVEAIIEGDREPLKMTICCDKSGTWRRAAA